MPRLSQQANPPRSGSVTPRSSTPRASTPQGSRGGTPRLGSSRSKASGGRDLLLSSAIEKSMAESRVSSDAKQLQAAELEASKVVLTAAELVHLVERQESMAAECLAECSAALPLVVRFFAVLDARKYGPADIVEAMDWNKDQRITKMEFRAGFRKLCKESIESSDIDRLFASIDLDRGGTLDEAELKAAVKQMHGKVAQANTTRQAAEEKLMHWQRRSEQTRHVIKAYGAVDQAKEALATLQGDRSLGARLGEALHRLHLSKNSLEVSVRFDTSGDGSVSIAEFQKGVVGFVADTTADEINDLFASIDKDCSGSIDLSELKMAMKDLRSAATAAAGEEVKMRKTIQRLRKVAHRGQLEVQMAKMEDDAIRAREQNAPTRG